MRIAPLQRLGPLVLAGAVVVAASWPRAALPQTPPEETEQVDPDAERKSQAGQYYMEGQDLYDRELYQAAIRAWMKAHEIWPAPVNVYNIAKAYERLGEAGQCIKWYEDYVDLYRKANDREPPDIVDIKNSIAKCRLGTALELTIESEPPGANIYLDDKNTLLGQTPFVTRREPGTYKLYLEAKGYQPFETDFQVRQGEARKFVFKLEPVRNVGVVKLRSNIKGANIFVDGRNIGITPYQDDIVLQEGRHQILVTKDDYEEVSHAVQVARDGVHELDAELWLRDPPSTWKSATGWTLVATGVLLGVGGGIASWQADKEYRGTQDFEDLEQLQDIGYIGGGVAGGLGILLLILEGLDDQAVKPADAIAEGLAPKKARASVLAAPNGAMLDVRF